MQTTVTCECGGAIEVYLVTKTISGVDIPEILRTFSQCGCQVDEARILVEIMDGQDVYYEDDEFDSFEDYL